MKDHNDDFEEDQYDEYGDNPNFDSAYKYYFKFDPQAWDVWSKFLTDAFKDVVEPQPNVWYIYGYPNESFPVNSYLSSTGKGSSYQYLGNNYDGVKIWKKKYFAVDPIQASYVNHIQAHAVYFIREPHYYKGLFDILN